MLYLYCTGWSVPGSILLEDMRDLPDGGRRLLSWLQLPQLRPQHVVKRDRRLESHRLQGQQVRVIRGQGLGECYTRLRSLMRIIWDRRLESHWRQGQQVRVIPGQDRWWGLPQVKVINEGYLGQEAGITSMLRATGKGHPRARSLMRVIRGNMWGSSQVRIIDQDITPPQGRHWQAKIIVDKAYKCLYLADKEK